jgi:hypothetical protein
VECPSFLVQDDFQDRISGKYHETVEVFDKFEIIRIEAGGFAPRAWVNMPHAGKG